MTDEEKQLTRIALSATRQDGFWALPLGAKVDRSGGNEIAMSHIGKNRDYGTVKESWGRGDWKFELTGTLIDGEAAYGTAQPIDQQMDTLVGLLTNKLLYVQGGVFAEVGVDQVVVTDWKFPYTPGIANQKFQLTLVSDYPFELV